MRIFISLTLVLAFVAFGCLEGGTEERTWVKHKINDTSTNENTNVASEPSTYDYSDKEWVGFKAWEMSDPAQVPYTFVQSIRTTVTPNHPDRLNAAYVAAAGLDSDTSFTILGPKVAANSTDKNNNWRDYLRSQIQGGDIHLAWDRAYLGFQLACTAYHTRDEKTARAPTATEEAACLTEMENEKLPLATWDSSAAIDIPSAIPPTGNHRRLFKLIARAAPAFGISQSVTVSTTGTVSSPGGTVYLTAQACSGCHDNSLNYKGHALFKAGAGAGLHSKVIEQQGSESFTFQGTSYNLWHAFVSFMMDEKDRAINFGATTTEIDDAKRWRSLSIVPTAVKKDATIAAYAAEKFRTTYKDQFAAWGLTDENIELAKKLSAEDMNARGAILGVLVMAAQNYMMQTEKEVNEYGEAKMMYEQELHFYNMCKSDWEDTCSGYGGCSGTLESTCGQLPTEPQPGAWFNPADFSQLSGTKNNYWDHTYRALVRAPATVETLVGRFDQILRAADLTWLISSPDARRIHGQQRNEGSYGHMSGTAYTQRQSMFKAAFLSDSYPQDAYGNYVSQAWLYENQNKVKSFRNCTMWEKNDDSLGGSGWQSDVDCNLQERFQLSSGAQKSASWDRLLSAVTAFPGVPTFSRLDPPASGADKFGVRSYCTNYVTCTNIQNTAATRRLMVAEDSTPNVMVKKFDIIFGDRAQTVAAGRGPRGNLAAFRNGQHVFESNTCGTCHVNHANFEHTILDSLARFDPISTVTANSPAWVSIPWKMNKNVNAQFKSDQLALLTNYTNVFTQFGAPPAVVAHNGVHFALEAKGGEGFSLQAQDIDRNEAVPYAPWGAWGSFAEFMEDYHDVNFEPYYVLMTGNVEADADGVGRQTIYSFGATTPFDEQCPNLGAPNYDAACVNHQPSDNGEYLARFPVGAKVMRAGSAVDVLQAVRDETSHTPVKRVRPLSIQTVAVIHGALANITPEDAADLQLYFEASAMGVAGIVDGQNIALVKFVTPTESDAANYLSRDDRAANFDPIKLANYQDHMEEIVCTFNLIDKVWWWPNCNSYQGIDSGMSEESFNPWKAAGLGDMPSDCQYSRTCSSSGY